MGLYGINIFNKFAKQNRYFLLIEIDGTHREVNKRNV